MLVIRPVAPTDLDALLELATLTGFGLTTLPRDRDLLRKRISRSQRSFAECSAGTAPGQPAGESYLFVMEDLATNQVVGTSGILSKVGGFEPFYAYQIETAVHESSMLNVRKEIQTLHLVMEHNGPTEIGSLFLAPTHRRGGNGRLLSLSRFLFMAEHPECFEKMVIAEMRGVIDEQGRSAFWDALGKHFFDIDFPKADYLSMVNKRFIADLMPKYPIYIPLLPEEAQRVIGQVHDQTRPALRLLESEDFKTSGMVDIFEAGPIVTCPLTQIRTLSHSRRAIVTRVVASPSAAPVGATPASPSALPPSPGTPREGRGEGPNAEPYLIATTSTEFRATVAPLHVVSDNELELDRETAHALHIKKGQTVRVAPLRSPQPQEPHEQSLHPQHLDNW